MSKEEMRQALSERQMVAGDLELEQREIRKLQKKNVQGFETITVTCSNFLTLICCP